MNLLAKRRRIDLHPCLHCVCNRAARKLGFVVAVSVMKVKVTLRSTD